MPRRCTFAPFIQLESFERWPWRSWIDMSETLFLWHNKMSLQPLCLTVYSLPTHVLSTSDLQNRRFVASSHFRLEFESSAVIQFDELVFKGKSVHVLWIQIALGVFLVVTPILNIFLSWVVIFLLLNESINSQNVILNSPYLSLSKYPPMIL